MADWRYEDEWFEETNVSWKIREYLESNGFTIEKFNDDKKQRGYDIIATKSDERYIIEVKGYPSDKYVSGPKQGQKKPTQPRLQAKHWFSEALLSLLKAKNKDQLSKTVLGLPKFEIYEKLLDETKFARTKLGIEAALVDSQGKMSWR